MSKRIAISEECSIPGYHLYNGEVPEKITLRAMTTVEEKMRLAGSGFMTMPKLIEACQVDSDVNIANLKLFDIQYLMYRLRTITYGNDYHITLRCPNCGKELQLVVNLDDIPVEEVPEGMKEPIELDPLPVSGDVIECRILTAADYDAIGRDAKRIKNKYPNYVGDPEFILTYEKKISKVNGEEVPAHKIQKYIEEMHARDLRFFDSKYAEVTDKFGMDTVISEVCSSCGRDFEFGLPITEEFFRPVY